MADFAPPECLITNLTNAEGSVSLLVTQEGSCLRCGVFDAVAKKAEGDVKSL